MEWEILKAKPLCESCGITFLDNQAYLCLLKPEGDLWMRSDYCQACWDKAVQPQLSTIKEYAAWTGRFKVVVPVPKTEVVEKDHAQRLFRKLLASGDPTKKNSIFVIAVMLERKKILKQQKVIRNEGISSAGAPARVLVYTHNETSETIFIEDPQIRLPEWNKIQHEVKELLEQEIALLRAPDVAPASKED